MDFKARVMVAATVHRHQLTSSVASPICQEGQIKWQNLPNFCLFFMIFPLFSQFLLIFSFFFPIFGKFFAVMGGTLPPPMATPLQVTPHPWVQDVYRPANQCFMSALSNVYRLILTKRLMSRSTPITRYCCHQNLENNPLPCVQKCKKMCSCVQGA